MSPALSKDASSIPEGNYKVVTISLDLTGKKLNDEICQIGAFSFPDKTFSQYVMPHRDVSRSATRTHGIRIFTNFGRFRVLKDVKTMKTLKSKSAYSALADFMDWLKEVKGNSDGVILAYHGVCYRDNVVIFLVTILEQYKMIDSFVDIVKGFGNCYALASEREDLKDRSMTLRSLLRQLLDFDEEMLNGGNLRSAAKRAELIYNIIAKMLNCDGEIASNDFKTLCSSQEQICQKQREVAWKVKSLRPIFLSRIREGAKERGRAVLLRSFLIEIGADYSVIKSAYETGAEEDIAKIVEATGASKKKKDAEELVQLIVAHFKDGGEKENANSSKQKNEIRRGEPGLETIVEEKGSSSETDEDNFEEANADSV